MEVYKFILALLEKEIPFNFVAQNRFYFVLFIVFFFWITAQVVLFLFRRVFAKIVKKTKTKIDDMLLEAVEHPLVQIIIFVGLIVGVLSLNLSLIIEIFLVRICSSAIIIYIGVAVYRVCTVLIEKFGLEWARKTKSTVNEDLVPIFSKVVHTLVVILCALSLLVLWGFAIQPFLASLGIAGITVGLALKDSLANIFGGVSLILDRTFKVGDYVKLESGEKGLIYDIGLRATKLKTFDNELLIIPNGGLVKSRIKNYVLPSQNVRISIELLMLFGFDMEKTKQLIFDILGDIENVLPNPSARVDFLDIKEGVVKLGVRFWVENPAKGYFAKNEFNESFYRKSMAMNLPLAQPTQVIKLKKG